MRVNKSIRGLSRREFIQTAGLGVIASAAVPATEPLAALGCQSGALRDQALKVGVLVPTSRIYPLLGEHFRAGIKTYLLKANRSLNLQFYDADPNMILTATQKLVVEDRVDLVVALIGANLADRLRPIFDEAHIPLIVADIGANAIRPDERSPYVVYNSLDLWQANWAMAAQAVGQFGHNVVTAASFYESGYDALYAVQLGVESAGGKVVDTLITHTAPQSSGIEAALAAIRAAHPDSVFAHYSGQESVEFLDAYLTSGLSGDIPLVTSGFALHDHALTALGNELVGVQSGLSWSNSLPYETNTQFTAAFRDFSGYSADALAVLGYDTAHLIDHAAGAAGSFNPDRMMQALNAAQIDSPRGLLTLNPATRSFGSPIYQREVRPQGLALANVAVAALDGVSAQEAWAKLPETSIRSGWLNPYLSL